VYFHGCERFFFFFLEWILLLEIQTNFKNWVWMNECVHTLGPRYLHIAKFRNSGALFLLFVGPCLLRED
jgi:hypothetical protein